MVPQQREPRERPRRHRVRGRRRARITWQSAPALTEVEQVVTDWLRDLCGLAPEWRGAIQDTASTACLVAMLAARERASDGSEHRGGLQALDAPLVAYTSPQAHSSVPKAVLLAGFGPTTCATSTSTR